MTQGDRDLLRVDELLRAHARSPGPPLGPAVRRRLELPSRRSLVFLRPLALVGTAAAAFVAVGALAGFAAGRHGAPVVAAPSPVRSVHFALVAPGAHTVVLVGDFNGWAPEKGTVLTTDGARFIATLELPPGRYAYAFVVDGEQVVNDPDAPASEPDGFGGRNSVLEL